MTDKDQLPQIQTQDPDRSFNTDATNLILVPETFKAITQFAEIMATGKSTVPKHFQGNKGDCMAVCMQAMQWKMNPFAVAQKTFVVGGHLGYEGQLVNAVITSSGVTKDRMSYEWFGPWENVIGKFKEVVSKKKVDEDTGEPLKYRVPNWTLQDEAGIGIRVSATLKGESQPRILELFLTQCRVRNSPLWADDPRQQIAYLAVRRWARLFCPDVILGVYVREELEEEGRIAPRDTDITENGAGSQGDGRKPNPDYPKERFDSMLPKWTKTIGDGIRTRQQVIDQVETSYTLSKEQKERIMALKEGMPPEDVKSEAAKSDTTPAVKEVMPPMDDAAFKAWLPKWEKTLRGGIKPDDLIELIEETNTLTKAQKDGIRSIAPQQGGSTNERNG